MPILNRFKQGVDVAIFKADQLQRLNRVQGKVNNLRKEHRYETPQMRSALGAFHIRQRLLRLTSINFLFQMPHAQQPAPPP